MSGPRLLLLPAVLCAALLTSTPGVAQEPTPAPAQPPAPERPVDPPRAPEDPPEPLEPQVTDPTRPGRKPGPSIRARVFGLAGFQSFTATDSFDAVLNTSSGAVYGGGAGVLFGRNLFVDVAVSRFSADGSRVFIADGGEVIDLGIPTQVTVTPIDVSFGWRFAGAPRPRPDGKSAWRPVPFAGGGFGFQQYEETADFAESGEDVSESHGSYHVLGGVELPFGQRLGVVGDVLYRWVPDGLGSSGVSAYYDETDLGGAQVRVRVVFTF
jgi:hypothetical protein